MFGAIQRTYHGWRQRSNRKKAKMFRQGTNPKRFQKGWLPMSAKDARSAAAGFRYLERKHTRLARYHAKKAKRGK